MKRRLLALLLAVLTLTMLTAAAFAADATEGVYNIRTITNYKMTVDGVTGENGFYAKADKFKLTCSKLTGQYSLVFLINVTTGKTDTIVPTADNLHYIDQQSVAATTTFDLIPKALTTGKYHVYVTTDGESGQKLTMVASFEYGTNPGYRLGDVNKDGNITPYDASLVLQHNVKLIDLVERNWGKAADVNTDESITPYDASLILQYLVGLITLG